MLVFVLELIDGLAYATAPCLFVLAADLNFRGFACFSTAALQRLPSPTAAVFHSLVGAVPLLGPVGVSLPLPSMIISSAAALCFM